MKSFTPLREQKQWSCLVRSQNCLMSTTEGLQARWRSGMLTRWTGLLSLLGKVENTTVADFGCGDAKIARSLTNAVFSFDLVKCNEHVIVANSAKVPLGDKSVDIAVFCLSLMGTDFKDFIREARRVLRSKGKLVVAEVSSRIEDIDVLSNGIEELGFSLLKKSEPNSYFVELVFKKVKPKENKGKFEGLLLKPCTYKKR